MQQSWTAGAFGSNLHTMTERRYNEAEVAAIFERATEGPQASSPGFASDEGMTLAQIQEIGAEIGIPANSIARAASAVELTPASAPAPRKVFGLTTQVSRTMQLDRALTNTEWEHLVVELREIFNAQGNMSTEGSLRAWTNGNLQVMLEPTSAGQRIRLRTVKADAGALLVVGAIISSIATLLLGAAWSAEKLGDKGMFAALGFMGVAGVGMLVSTGFRVSRWARTRQQQFDSIAARVALLAKAPSPDSDNRKDD